MFFLQDSWLDDNCHCECLHLTSSNYDVVNLEVSSIMTRKCLIKLSSHASFLLTSNFSSILIFLIQSKHATNVSKYKSILSSISNDVDSMSKRLLFCNRESHHNFLSHIKAQQKRRLLTNFQTNLSFFSTKTITSRWISFSQSSLEHSSFSSQLIISNSMLNKSLSRKLSFTSLYFHFLSTTSFFSSFSSSHFSSSMIVSFFSRASILQTTMMSSQRASRSTRDFYRYERFATWVILIRDCIWRLRARSRRFNSISRRKLILRRWKEKMKVWRRRWKLER